MECNALGETRVTETQRSPGGTRTVARRHWVEALLVLAGFGLLAVLLTWPLAANFSTHIVGGGGAGDQVGYLWDIWSNANHGIDLWGAGLQDHVGLPFGRTIIGGANLLLLAYNLPTVLLAGIVPTIAAYNTVVLSGLALSGASMYLLIRWLGISAGPAAVAGTAFCMFPYEALRVAAHPPLAALAFAPLVLMACIWWVQRPSALRACTMAAAVLFAWVSNPYFGAMALVMAGVTVILGVGLTLRRHSLGQALRAGATAAGSLVVLVAIPLLLIISASQEVADQVATRQAIELEIYGARLSDYLAPIPGQFLWSGIFGDDVAQWPLSSPGGERTTFLGWTVFALALVGVALVWRRRASIAPRLKIAVYVVVPIGFAMTLLSLASPYEIFGRRIPMLSSIIFDVLPFLRVYARFGLVVMACALVLAAIALALLTDGRTTPTRLSVLSGAAILVLMETSVAVPWGTDIPLRIEGRPATNVPTWQWMARNGQGRIAIETPAFPNEMLDREFLFGQLTHGRPLANGGLNEPGLPSDFAREYGNPLFPAAPTAYATAGIDDVIINPWAWRQAGIAPPNPTAPPQGYEVSASFADGSAVWRVAAKAAKAVAFPSFGWWDPETRNGQRWRYMKANAGYISYAPRSARVTFRMNIRGVNPTSSYLLSIRDPAGIRHRFTVRRERRIDLKVEVPQGAGRFHLSVSGAKPQAIAPGDPRTATLEISEWRSVGP